MDKNEDRFQLAITLENEKLLSEEQQTDSTEEDETSAETRQFWSGSKQRTSHALFIYHTIVHVFLVISVIYIGARHFRTPRILGLHSYTPAANAIEFYGSDVDPLTHSHRSIYSGKPTKENIAAWDDLVDPTFIAITEEELIRSGTSPERAVRLADYEGEFVAGTGVYHHLHCLRRLRWWVYQDHFYSNMSEVNLDVVLPHLAHCIEGLRFALMCFPDLNLYTFEWDEPNAIRPDPHTTGTRQCLKWDALDKWSRERSVGYDPKLIRPIGNSESIHMI